MSTMTIKEITQSIRTLPTRETPVTREDLIEILNALYEIIEEQALKGELIRIRHMFGADIVDGAIATPLGGSLERRSSGSDKGSLG